METVPCPSCQPKEEAKGERCPNPDRNACDCWDSGMCKNGPHKSLCQHPCPTPINPKSVTMTAEEAKAGYYDSPNPKKEEYGMFEARIDRNLHSFRALPLTPEIRDEDFLQLRRWMLEDFKDCVSRLLAEADIKARREQHRLAVAAVDSAVGHDLCRTQALSALVRMKPESRKE